MRDNILMFLLAFVLWAWVNLHLRRAKKQKIIQEETKEMLVERLKAEIKSFKKQGGKATTLKKIGVLSQSINSFKTNVYPYLQNLQKERRSGRERRKSRLAVGITFKYIDRRQADSTQYKGPERRSGMDRRGGTWDRRKLEPAH